MVLSCASNLTLELDAPLSAIVEPGHGCHVRPGDVDWAYSDIVAPSDQRGYFLNKLQSRPGWRTTTVGTGYVRKRLADYSGTTNWDEVQWFSAGDWWLVPRSDSPDPLTTAGTSWSASSSGLLWKNPHLVVEAWIYGAHATTDAVLQLDWGTKWRLILYGNGTATLSESVDGSYEQRASGTLIRGVAATGGLIRFQVSPLFHRCLYLFGSGGGELVYEDLSRELDTDATGPDATSPMVPAGTLTITPYRRVALLVTEAAFVDSGTMLGLVTLPYAPAATSTLTFTDADGGSLHWLDTPTNTTCVISAVKSDGTAWAPDGTSTTFYLKAAFGRVDGGRFRTPVLYAAGFRLNVTTAPGITYPTSVLEYIRADATYEVDEESAHMRLTVQDQAQLKGKLNRRLLMKLDDFEEFDGSASLPEYEAQDPYSPVTFDVEDAAVKRARNTLLPGTEAYDGGKLTTAIESVLTYLGYTSADWDIQASDFRLPSKKTNVNHRNGGADNEPLVQPSRGTRAWEFLTYLVETYSNGWRIVRQPVSGAIKWVIGDDDHLRDRSGTQQELFLTFAGAQAAGYDWRYVVRDWRTRTLEPEANDFLVVGQAPGGAPLTARYSDWASMDPGLEEQDRPANWVGEPRQYLLVDASLCTQALCDTAATWLYNRGGKAIRQASFLCEWHPQLHRESEVIVDGETYRVKSYRVALERETDWPGGGGKWRPCEYTVEKVL